MQPNSSAAVIEISEDAVPQAEQILKVLGATQIVTEAIDSSVDALFEGESAPAPDTEIASAART
jgi:hypothetical protein